MDSCERCGASLCEFCGKHCEDTCDKARIRALEKRVEHLKQALDVLQTQPVVNPSLPPIECPPPIESGSWWYTVPWYPFPRTVGIPTVTTAYPLYLTTSTDSVQ